MTTMKTEESGFAATSLVDSAFADLSAQAIYPQHKGICFMGNEKFYLLKLGHIPQSAQHSSGTCHASLFSDSDLCISHLDIQIFKVSFTPSFINSAKNQ